MQCHVNSSMEWNRDFKKKIYVSVLPMCNKVAPQMYGLQMKVKSVRLIEESVSEYLCDLRAQ